MPKIECRNLRKVYAEGIYALDGIDFTLNSGDFLTIMGESGGGKTTLLKCIAGLLPITAGELYVDGEICNNSPVQERKIGAVFQEFTLYPNMTVFENVAFALKKQKLSFPEECARVRQILDSMGILELQSALPRQLSYGQKQKVALARALVKNPDIVLFDEPLSNIDEPSRVQYREMIRKAKDDYPDSTFIYVTHNLADAISLGNKTMIIHHGKVLQFCQSKLLLRFPGSIAAAQYLFGACECSDVQIQNGRIYGQNGEILLDGFLSASLPWEEYEGRKLQYVDNGDMTMLFYQGNAVCGVRDEYLIPCEVERKRLHILGGAFDISELSDGLLRTGPGTAVLRREYLSMHPQDDAISFLATVKYADTQYIVIEADGHLLSDCNQIQAQAGDQVRLYYPVSKIKILNTEGNILLASYLLSDNCFTAKVLSRRNGLIRLGGKTVTLGKKLTKGTAVDIKIEADGFFLAGKKRGIPIKVINEERCSGFTICYGYLKDQSDYITAILPPNTHCFTPEGLYLEIGSDQIHVMDRQRSEEEE